MECCTDLTPEGNRPAFYQMKPAVSGDNWKGPEFTFSKNSVPMDFTGALIEMGFCLNSKQGKLHLLLSSDKDDFTINANSISINERKLDLSAGRYFFDLQITFPGLTPVVKTYLEGTFEVLRDITP